MVTDAMQSLEQVAATQEQGQHAAQLLQSALALVSDEMADVRQQLASHLGEIPGCASTAASHLVESGGKGIRPMLTLLGARAVGGDPATAVPFAVAAEMIHNATLLHDDVIDDGTQRRGRPTPRTIWGNTVSVLSGDLLFIEALRMVEATGAAITLREMMDTVALLVEGEVIQLEHRDRLDLPVETYERIVECKTASLFQWCAVAGGRAGGGDDAQIQALGRFGRHVGRAFQVRDDVLDLVADPDRLGKDLAADLSGGKVTLPVLFALQDDPALAAALHDGPERALPILPAALRRTDALARARDWMQAEIDSARLAARCLPSGPAATMLLAVADAIGSRDH
jgi:octaprenyl-diphosphate synthase